MEAIMGIILICTGFLLYFLPAFIASNRDHVNVAAVAVANLFLGWTFLGWVLCLIWALTNNTRNIKGE